MKRFRQHITICLIGIIATLLLCSCATSTPPPAISESLAVAPETQPTTSSPTMLLRTLYYERELFLSGISAPRAYEAPSAPVGGIVPHHLLASDMICGFFSVAAQYKDQYDTVILLSTSHFPQNSGGNPVSAAVDWITPYGKVSADADAVQALLANPQLAAENNPTALEADHGVAGLIPYVKYYLPDAKVAACVVPNSLSSSQLAALQQEIIAISKDKRILFVASIDFSHYLMPTSAREHDAQTAKAIAAFDFNRIATFTDSNLDSPQTLAVFLKLAEQLNIAPSMLDHSDSAEKLPQALANPIYRDGITSYFVYALWSGEQAS